MANSVNEIVSPSVLTQEQLSALLQISPRTLEEWRQRHVGPPYLKLGHLVRYEMDSVVAWSKKVEVNA